MNTILREDEFDRDSCMICGATFELHMAVGSRGVFYIDPEYTMNMKVSFYDDDVMIMESHVMDNIMVCHTYVYNM